MSLRNWKREFYPVPAKEVPVEEALDHSIRKWTGLLEENRKRYKVQLEFKVLSGTGREQGHLSISTETCALCVHYLEDAIQLDPCNKCPLARLREGNACDQTMVGETGLFALSPYAALTVNGDARPMLALLLKAKWRGFK